MNVGCERNRTENYPGYEKNAVITSLLTLTIQATTCCEFLSAGEIEHILRISTNGSRNETECDVRRKVHGDLTTIGKRN